MCEQIAKLDEEIMRQLEIQATLQAEIDAIQHQYRDQKLQMKALLADKDELNRGATQQLSQNSQSHSTMSRSDSDSSCSLDFSNVDLEMFAKKKVDRPESSLARAKRNLAETGLLKGGAAASQSTAKKQKSPKKRKMAEAEDVDILQMFD